MLLDVFEYPNLMQSDTATSNPDEIFRAFDRCRNQKISCENASDLRTVFSSLKPSRVLDRTAQCIAQKTVRTQSGATACEGLGWNCWKTGPGWDWFWMSPAPTLARQFYLLLLLVPVPTSGCERSDLLALQKRLFSLRHFQLRAPSQSWAKERRVNHLTGLILTFICHIVF